MTVLLSNQKAQKRYTLILQELYNFMKKSKMKFSKGWWDGAYYLIIVDVDEIKTASVV